MIGRIRNPRLAGPLESHNEFEIHRVDPGQAPEVPAAGASDVMQSIMGLVGKIAHSSFKKDGRVLGGTNAGALGTSIQLKVPVAFVTAILAPPTIETAAQTFTPIFDARAHNPNSPQVVTVACSSPQIDFDSTGNPPTANFDIKGRIEWGTGGGRNQADFDVRDGANITVLGTYVRLSAIYTAIGSASGIPNVQMSGAISYGTRAGGQTPPTWTGVARTLATGNSVAFLIPPFATDVVVYAIDHTTGLSAAITIDISTSGVVNAPGMTIVQAANSNPVYRIPHVCREVIVTNATGHDITVTPVFGLNL